MRRRRRDGNCATCLELFFRLIFGARRPIVTGSVRVEGCRQPITIRRDRNGVAYIDASNDEDVFFGLGFCQAQDRAFQIELFLRVCHGTLSELVGAEMLDADRLARRVGFARIAVAQLAACDEPTQAQFHAFARGVNAGIERGRPKRPHELAILGRDPTLAGWRAELERGEGISIAWSPEEVERRAVTKLVLCVEA